MTKKICLTSMLSILLVCAIVLSGCPNSSSEPSDTWTKTTDVNDLAGKWSGKGAISIPAQSFPMGDFGEGASVALPQSSMGIEMTLDCPADNPTATVSMTMNVESVLDAVVKAIKESLGMPITKDFLWQMMQGDSAKKYYVTQTYPVPKNELLSTGGEVKINQNRTKLQVILPKAAFGETGVTVGDVWLTLHKQ